MNQKVLTVLEYNKIIEMLAEYATSPLGREKAFKLQPSSDLEAIKSNQRNTADALSRLIKRDSVSFGNNKPLGRSLKSLDIEATLSSRELLDIAGFLDNLERVKRYGIGDDSAEYNQDSLTDLFAALTPHPQVSKEINRCIITEEDMADDASPGLKSIRRAMAAAGEKIHTELNSMVNGSLRTYLQDAVITQRGGRYCIPVKAEYKSQVHGMIHDQSSTGSTIFIEPQAIVNLNNRIRELEIEEKQEIERILAELSAQVGEYTTDINVSQKAMTELDFIFAKAHLALHQNASEPIFNDEHIINIRKGRHPLLDPKKVVPIDVRLGEDFDLLVITGPNTGGKTVSLKTVGLLTLMGQAGLHIPAGDRSILSVFHKIYADIGDEQSIEQSLSTFSSHMKNIVAILKNADSDSLCLFDELGAGTDPTEGAALAIAILNHLHERGIRAMATTHYSELKIYALRTPHVENACQEFDVDTLSPTYRLLIGIPGKSNAFAISKRLGLRDDIIESAKQQISEEQESFEDVIVDLENSRRGLEADRAQVAEMKARIKELQDALQRKNEKIDNARDRIIKEAHAEAREILKEAKDVADETIRNFQRAGINANIRELEKDRGKIRERVKDADSKLSIKSDSESASKGKKNLKPEDIKTGDAVKVISMGMEGTVSTLPDAKGDLFVQCGIMRTKTNIKNLVLLPSQSHSQDETSSKNPYAKLTAKGTKGSDNKSGVSSIRMSKSLGVSSEINLLGKTVDEAIFELDKYLDDAYLAHLPSVRIVHGKGTGALRQAVMRHLKKTKYVKNFRQGEYGEGDAGVTICEFKE